MTSQLRFVGDHVLIPANQMFCVVLRPSGAIVMGHCNSDEAVQSAAIINAMLSDYDCLGIVETAEVVSAADLIPEQRKRGNRPAVQLASAS